MKKLTTTMMQETLNKHDAHLTVGLDLGDRSSFLLRAGWDRGCAARAEGEHDA
jgi:hypothetical protein